jgi:hypothetical protein
LLWLLVANFSPWEHRFAPRAAHVDFVVDRVALELALLRELLFFLVGIIALLLCIHSCVIGRMDHGCVSCHFARITQQIVIIKTKLEVIKIKKLKYDNGLWVGSSL